MQTVSVLGAKKNSHENNVKGAVGRILEVEWTMYNISNYFRFHPNTPTERLLISPPAKEGQTGGKGNAN
jgi:hypothetical protein